MRAVLQRVRKASVTVEQKVVGQIAQGWLVLLGVGRDDCEADTSYLAQKTLHLRAFSDDQGRMNRSVLDTQGNILVVSQFTLYGDCRKGRRPGWSNAAPPDQAVSLYELYCQQLRQGGLGVQTGVFQAHMDVELVNDGPVTLLLDSKKRF